MEFISSSEHLCYVRCNFCSTILAVGVPCKRLLDTVTVKCGHCSNLSFITTRPALAPHLPPPAAAPAPSPSPHPPPPPRSHSFPGSLSLLHIGLQPTSSSSSPSSSPAASDDSVPRVHHVVKPPEKKHRLPSAYNRFMREEIQRIKASTPQITHREAFSMAAKNWARFDPQLLLGSASETGKQESSHITK
ncbi:protein DROOPING LEAF isoform X2 [Nymphaea colorata]|uniref:protein DROOPING LEAF isoform X2 n=1 Tax=Nymphaea colorata TaxID=210225 RepID=UPI00214EED8A|nr:protein DROOPING LEAF isoform X2 [Nymphaea colorata]